MQAEEQGSQKIYLAALHQHPERGSFAVIDYVCSCSSGVLEVVSWQDPLLCGGSGCEAGGSLGAPRGLVQLPPLGHQQQPPQQARLRLVLREHGVQPFLAAAGEAQQAAAAAAAAQEWWRTPQPEAAGAGQAAAAAAEPEGPEPMAVSQQASYHAVPEFGEEEESEDGDEEMHAAGDEPEEAPAAAGAAAGSAGTMEGLPAATVAEILDSHASTFLTCCCWDWEAARQPGRPLVLVCATEAGGLCRLPLLLDWGAVGASADGGANLPPPLLLPDAAGAVALQPARLGQPARQLAGLPGGLLLYCTDSGGLQLLRLSGGSDGSSSAAAASYEPLLPPHLAAQQAEGAAPGAAGCCTLPAAAAVVDCQLADLEGAGQQQLYALCCTTGSSGGSLCVLYRDPKPETVFELPGAAQASQALRMQLPLGRCRCHLPLCLPACPCLHVTWSIAAI